MSQKVNPHALRSQLRGTQKKTLSRSPASIHEIFFSEPKNSKWGLNSYSRIFHEDQSIEKYLEGFFRSFGFYQQTCVIERKCNQTVHVTAYVLRTPQVRTNPNIIHRTPKEKVLQEGLDLPIGNSTKVGWVPTLLLQTITKILSTSSGPSNDANVSTWCLRHTKGINEQHNDIITGNHPHIDMKSSNQADRVTNSMSKTYNQVSVKDSFLIHTQGSIAYINLRTKKERTNRSSMAFFDLGEKKPVSYNLKHWFRYNFNMERVTSKLNTNSPAAKILQKYQLRSKLFMSNPLVDPHKVDRVSSILNSESQNSISLPWAISSGTRLKKSNVKYSTPDEVRSQIQKNVIWDWVNHCSFHDEPITGRVARSLNQAGICVLLGGFPAFLPHRQYSFRNEIISKKQGQLESFQIISLKGPKKGSLLKKEDKWNCVLSKDQFIRSCARKF